MDCLVCGAVPIVLLSVRSASVFQYKQWCLAMDQGKIPSEIKALLSGEEQSKPQQNVTKLSKAAKADANSHNPCTYLGIRIMLSWLRE